MIFNGRPVFQIREDEEARSTKVGTPVKGALPKRMLSPSDTAIVFLLALLLFGPEQLPRIARQLGEAMRHIQTTTHTFMNEMERAARVDESPATHVDTPPLPGEMPEAPQLDDAERSAPHPPPAQAPD